VHFSSSQEELTHKNHYRHSGKGGIVLGISTDIANPGTFARVNTPETNQLGGHIIHCTLKRNYPTLQQPLNIVGVYMPEDMEKRRLIYSYIHKVVRQCTRTGEELMVLGDFNAVLHVDDRTGPLDGADRLHQSECSSLNLNPLGNALPGRPHTFRKSQSPLLPLITSQIDDILVWKPPSNPPHPPMTEAIFEPGGNLDHTALVVHLPLNLIPTPPLNPTPEIKYEPSLAMPIKGT
jgi:hypothetical protein